MRIAKTTFNATTLGGKTIAREPGRASRLG
jgi:hypothetical protein